MSPFRLKGLARSRRRQAEGALLVVRGAARRDHGHPQRRSAPPVSTSGLTTVSSERARCLFQSGMIRSSVPTRTTPAATSCGGPVPCWRSGGRRPTHRPSRTVTDTGRSARWALRSGRARRPTHRNVPRGCRSVTGRIERRSETIFGVRDPRPTPDIRLHDTADRPIGVALDLRCRGTQWTDSFRPDELEPISAPARQACCRSTGIRCR